jgi:hypothetical protein
MRYHLGHVVLDLPLVLVDETTYVFQNKSQGLSLFVSFDPPAPGVSPNEVLDELSESIVKSFQGMCTQHFRKPLTFLGEPAAQAFLQLALARGGGEIHMLAATGARQVTLLRFITGHETTGGEGLATFERLLSTAAPAQAPWSGKTERAGFVRRQAGPITLEMPEVLAAPRSFSFTTQDGSVRLTLQYGKGAPEQGAPIFEDLLPPQAPGSQLRRISPEKEEKEEQPFAVAGLRGFSGRWELSSVLDRQERERYLVRRLSVQLPGGRTFQALGIARAPGIPTLESAWAQLTSTLRPGD